MSNEHILDELNRLHEKAVKCPRCGRTNVRIAWDSPRGKLMECLTCGKVWRHWE